MLGLATGPPAVHLRRTGRPVRGRPHLVQAGAGFTLDEYVGLPADNPETYRNVINTTFVSRVDFAPGAVQGPDGLATDIPASCAAYDQAIRDAGGVDLQILGIGTDGHIGFNEPGSSLASRTRIKTLTRQTRVDNARFFDGDLDAVPTHRRRRAGHHHGGSATSCWWPPAAARPKRCTTLVEGAPSRRCGPAASCSTTHVTVLLDDAAARRLQLADYFRGDLSGQAGLAGI